MNDIKGYLERMEAVMADKLFFLDKSINFDVLVDFGCANGALIKEVATIYPRKQYIGYDNSQEMIDMAEHNLSILNQISVDERMYRTNHFNLSTNWGNCKKLIQEIKENDKSTKIVLVLSSIIHEVYSYLNPKEIDDFWEDVLQKGLFDNIVIRDMMPNKTLLYTKPYDYGIDSLISTIKMTKLGRKQLEDYISIYCFNEENFKNSMYDIVHFLLKYKFIDNWDREVNENYFGLFLDDFLLKVINSKYNIQYLESFLLPYFKEWVCKEMEFHQIKDVNTHVKCILKIK